MPPLRGAKINSGFLLVRRRFGLLLFRGAQLIATVHTYFCSRPRKMATATFAHPSTNPPRFFHYACRHCALCHSRTTLLFDQRVHLTVHLLLFFLLLILSLSLFQFSLSHPFRFYCGENWPQLRWPGFPEIAITNHSSHVIYSYYLATGETLPFALSPLRYYMCTS